MGVLYCICEVHLFTFMLMPYSASLPNSTEQNTCDPQIESSFIPRFVLVFLLILRLLPIVVCALLLAKRTPLSESFAVLIEKLSPVRKKTRLYLKKDHYSSVNVEKKLAPQLANPPRAGGTPLPPIPSPTHIDHSISYNNAAYFATSGALGVSGSSRSSDISRLDAAEMFR
ncbi:hypothetical protein COOONC_10106 [Cooperia oncophora]